MLVKLKFVLQFKKITLLTLQASKNVLKPEQVGACHLWDD